MAMVSTTIKLDSELRNEAQALLDDFGLSLSEAVTLFLRQTIREGAIPFRIGQPVYNEETLRTIQDARNGIGLSKPFTSVDKMFAELNAEDDDDETGDA